MKKEDYEDCRHLLSFNLLSLRKIYSKMVCSKLSVFISLNTIFKLVTLLLLVSNYAMFGINISICKRNGFYNNIGTPVCYGSNLNSTGSPPNINISLCLDTTAIACRYVELGYGNNSKMVFTPYIVEHYLRHMLINCPSGCLQPIPIYPHTFNIANYISLNLENGTLINVTVNDPNSDLNVYTAITPQQYFLLRRFLLSCV